MKKQQNAIDRLGLKMGGRVTRPNPDTPEVKKAMAKIPPRGKKKVAMVTKHKEDDLEMN